ncbi:MAG: DEAD/DEAH box helicase [Pirellulales bacterium]
MSSQTNTSLGSTTSLAQRCRAEFERKDWLRGVHYFQANAVKIVGEALDGVAAEVRGSGGNRYTVAVSWEETGKWNELGVSCECGRFGDGYMCKHIAATILAIDLKGLSHLVPGRRDLVLNFLDELDDYSNGDDWADARKAQRLVRKFNARSPAKRTKTKPPPKPPDWRKHLDEIRRAAAQTADSGGSTRTTFPESMRVIYILDLDETQRRGRPLVVFHQQSRLKSGELGTRKRLSIKRKQILQLPDGADRALLSQLFGNRPEQFNSNAYGYSRYGYGFDSDFNEFTSCELATACFESLLPQLCATGRFGWLANAANDKSEPQLLQWDGGPPWQFHLSLVKDKPAKAWVVQADLQRNNESLPLAKPRLVLNDGLVVFDDCIARSEPLDSAMSQWVTFLRAGKQIRIPESAQDQFMRELLEGGAMPPIDLPEELRWERIPGTPAPRIVIRSGSRQYGRPELWADVFFAYGDREVAENLPADHVVDPENRRAWIRDRALEREHTRRLAEIGFKPTSQYEPASFDYKLPAKKLSAAVDRLTAAGWKVEAEGKLIRTPGKINISVTSGVDWFDLNMDCDFEGVKAALPDLLTALQRGQNYVELGDGTRGMLPTQWLSKYGPIAEMAKPNGDSLRFLPSQAMILDALLAAQPEADLDERFMQVREKLRTFDGVKPAGEPPSFQGELRLYQRDGLGWLNFLREFGFGGCLADDMGLGKTVQVLALLEQRRLETTGDKRRLPSLVVAPRSLIFNWLDESQRFTPQLRALNYTGLQRGEALDRLADCDLLITTYGTLRRDIVKLREIPFDYVILDESQAIKNSGSQSAKACRLLDARHRLTMTGTPVENHLGDLWSQFEFLNPGMLGRTESSSLFSGKSAKDPATLDLLRKALRPFLLRRTKEAVLSELPQKTEQTLFCELDPKQRKLYNDLRDHYRALLTNKIKDVGLAKSKIHVLEALLRLRQAACHPALIDKGKSKLPSAKLETLLEQLGEVLDEGHKALVFSQFTSLLAIVRKELDQRKLTYEYLDGKTRDRKSKVERFQSDPDCRLFLISLKAGGQGLNLTAADYVFILDPWWNPAVEAQAVDRAHRIGQTNPVFAYRLIAQDTVEEKILQLQGEKRKLAEAIVSADENLLRTLTADDLQMLLS